MHGMYGKITYELALENIREAMELWLVKNSPRISIPAFRNQKVNVTNALARTTTLPAFIRRNSKPALSSITQVS